MFVMACLKSLYDNNKLQFNHEPIVLQLEQRLKINFVANLLKLSFKNIYFLTTCESMTY